MSAADDASVYADLRAAALSAAPDDAGAGDAEVYGAVVDMAMGQGVATFVCLADGTTSMYTSTGGGVIGAGEHEPVAQVTRRFVADLASYVDSFMAATDSPLPSAGNVRFHALTRQGPVLAEASEAELAGGDHRLSPLFYEIHDVITALRLATPES